MIKPCFTAARITGTGCALPSRRLTNHELARLVDTNDEWIFSRTGIRERRIAESDDTTASLSVLAGRRALQDAGVDARDVGLVVVATVTPDTITPSTACLVQHALGVPTHAAAFDMNAACSGFLYGLATATQFIQAGVCRHALVIGAETLSRFVDYTDRATCILFGDGAGAALLSACQDHAMGVRAFQLGSDGGGAPLIEIPARGSRLPASAATVAEHMHYLKMKGRDVFRFAVNKMSDGISEAMSACNLCAEDITLVIPHQVNLRVIGSACEKSAIPLSKVFMNIEQYGNTSAASIPIALDEARRAGRCRPGDWVILVAFGGGLTWAAVAMRI